MNSEALPQIAYDDVRALVKQKALAEGDDGTELEIEQEVAGEALNALAFALLYEYAERSEAEGGLSLHELIFQSFEIGWTLHKTFRSTTQEVPAL